MNPPGFWRRMKWMDCSMVLDRLKQDGYAIVLITHKLKEVLECADRITVLRAGRVAGSISAL